MIVNTKTTKNQSQFNDCQNVCDAFIGFRLSSVQLAELKSQAKKEKGIFQILLNLNYFKHEKRKINN